MALPQLFQRLFQNAGAGPKLREEIIPIDNALSESSTNAVQNKIIKNQLDGKLSLTGGTFANQIIWLTFQKDLHISSTNNNTFLDLAGGLGGHGFQDKLCAQLILGGGLENASVAPGVFAINAANTQEACALFGYPNGSLSWGGHEVARVVSSGKSADGTQWYRKYNDGYIEQGGYYDNGSDVQGVDVTINFLMPFTSNIYSAVCSPESTQTTAWESIAVVRSRTSTSVRFAWWSTSTGIKSRYLMWFCCGY